MLESNILAGASGQGGDSAYKIERSLRFNSADSANLTRTPTVVGNKQKFTLSTWVKRSDVLNSYDVLLGIDSSFAIYFTNTDKLHLDLYAENGSNWAVICDTQAVFRDTSAWYHIVISIDSTTGSSNADRIKCWVNGVQQTFDFTTYWGGTITGNIARVNSSSYVHAIGSRSSDLYSDLYLAEYHFIDGQALAPTDFGEFDDNNVWQPKEFAGSYGTNGFHLDFADNVEPSSYSSNTSGNPYTGGGYSWAQVFNGTTTGSVLTYATTNTTCTLPADVTWSSKIRISALNYPDGYIKINGTTLSNSLFTTSQQWVDITSVLGSSGTLSTIEVGDVAANYFRLYAVELDGYILKDSNETSGLGKDTSGNANYFTPNNFSVTAGAGNDSLTDTPTNYGDDTGLGGEVRGNYATFNPLANYTRNGASGGGGGFKEGNLVVYGATTAETDIPLTMKIPTSGKYYLEITYTASPAGAGDPYINIYPNGNMDAGGLINAHRPASGNLIGLAFDRDTNNLYVYVNNVLTTTITTMDVSLEYDVSVYDYYRTNWTYTLNSGQRAWAYAPPSGYKALCTQNLPDPLVEDGSKYFDTQLHTGNGTSSTITFPFSPDLVWNKMRSSTGSHYLYDSVRGFVNTQSLSPDVTTPAHQSGYYTFSGTGNTITVADASGGNETNSSGNTYVHWAWDAGSSNTSIAAGDLNTSVYDQSQTWSNYLSCASGFYGGHPATEAFNTTYGSYTDMACNGASGDTVVYTHPVATTVTSLRFRFYGGQSHTITVAGQSFSVSNVIYSPVWTEVSLPSGGISLNGTSDTITIAGPNWNYLDSIEINGIHLVNPGVTVSSVPSIASTVRANPSAGFSIASYTGTGAAATVAHGLNAAPEFIITKARSNATSWVTGHSGIGWGNFLFLDTTDVSGASAAVWNSTAPDSNVFSVASSSYINPSGSGVIAYCFTGVEGYSKFGSYTGNGSADGPFVYTGFRPAWLLIKDTTSAYNWLVFDSERNTYNIVNNVLHPHLSNAENGGFDYLDFTSNGFKHRNNGPWHNTSGNTYIYAAFAEHPFKTSRAR